MKLEVFIFGGQRIDRRDGGEGEERGLRKGPIRVLPEVTEGFMAIMNELASLATSQTFEIGTKPSASLAD